MSIGLFNMKVYKNFNKLFVIVVLFFVVLCCEFEYENFVFIGEFT